jgi:septal ring factor EnvC (AmiA/AmiB activator)
MTVLKSGRKFPLSPEEPNLVKIEDRIEGLRAELKKDADELDRLKENAARCDRDVRDTLDKLDKLLASVGPVTNVVYNNASGVYSVSSNNSMSMEQWQLFNDLNNRLGALRREQKQTLKRIPDAEAELAKDRKTLEKCEADFASFQKENPAEAALSKDKELKERLAKLKNLFAEGLITKEQYDKSVYELLEAGNERK